MAPIKKRVNNIPKPTHFGKNLKLLRRLKGLSQTELANKLNLSRNNIASYESGVVEPNTSNFLATCLYFQIDPRKMLSVDLSKHPTKTTIETTDQDLLNRHVIDQMDLFIAQTNEMTKVLEGYRTFLTMKKESDNSNANQELFAIQEDLLDLLKNLLKSNWTLIRSVFPPGQDVDNNG